MNLLDLLRERGLNPRKVSSSKGGEYASGCPGCGGEDRFRCWPEQQTKSGRHGTWWCRQCGLGGDDIGLLMEFDGLSFREAAEKLGVRIDPMRSSPRNSRGHDSSRSDWTPCRHEDPAEAWQAQAARLVSWAHGKLMGNRVALEWLSARGYPPRRRSGSAWGGTLARTGRISTGTGRRGVCQKRLDPRRERPSRCGFRADWSSRAYRTAESCACACAGLNRSSSDPNTMSFLAVPQPRGAAQLEQPQ